MDSEPAVQMKRADAEMRVPKLSKLLGAKPGLNSSMVSLSVSNGRSLYLNSEGTFYEKSHPLVTLTAASSTQAADGMKLGDSVTFYSDSRDRLPRMTGLQPSLKKWEGGSNHFAMRLSLLATTVLYFLKAAPQQKSSPRNLQGVWRDSANLCPGWARWKRSLSVFLSSPDQRLSARLAHASCRIF